MTTTMMTMMTMMTTMIRLVFEYLLCLLWFVAASISAWNVRNAFTVYGRGVNRVVKRDRDQVSDRECRCCCSRWHEYFLFLMSGLMFPFLLIFGLVVLLFAPIFAVYVSLKRHVFLSFDNTVIKELYHSHYHSF